MMLAIKKKDKTFVKFETKKKHDCLRWNISHDQWVVTGLFFFLFVCLFVFMMVTEMGTNFVCTEISRQHIVLKFCTQQRTIMAVAFLVIS